MAAIERERLSAANVAITRLQRRRGDAKGDDKSLRRRLPRRGARSVEHVVVKDDVVGSQRKQDSVRIALQCEMRASSDRRGRVAPYRFNHDGRVNPDFLCLRAREKPKIVRCHHDRRSK